MGQFSAGAVSKLVGVLERLSTMPRLGLSINLFSRKHFAFRESSQNSAALAIYVAQFSAASFIEKVTSCRNVFIFMHM